MNMNAEFYLNVLAPAATFVSQVGFLRTGIHGNIVVWIGKDETLLLQELRQTWYLWASDYEVEAARSFEFFLWIFWYNLE